MKKRGAPVVIVVVLELLLSFGALYGGATLILAPDGSLLGISDADLAGSPFDSYLLPGIFLFLVIGVFPLVVAIAALRRAVWAVPTHFVLGVALMIFELIEWWAIGYHVLQAIYFVYGLVMAVLGLVVWRPGSKKIGHGAA